MELKMCTEDSLENIHITLSNNIISVRKNFLFVKQRKFFN